MLVWSYSIHFKMNILSINIMVTILYKISVPTINLEKALKTKLNLSKVNKTAVRHRKM